MGSADGGLGMKAGRRNNRIKQGLLWLLLFLCAYGLITLEARNKKVQGPVRRTTYSAAGGGYKVLYLWMQAMGVPVKRWENSFSDLGPEASVLLIADPEIGPGTGELKALKNWVLKGGTLILAIRPPNVFLKYFGLESAVGDHAKNGDHTVWFQPGYYTRGVRAIEGRRHPGLKSDRPEVIFHIRYRCGGYLAVMQEGKGRVIALADPSLFGNKSLKKGDHARLALNLLRNHYTEGALLFDEYHHGYGRATSVLVHFGRSRALEPLLQIMLLLLMLWAARGRRFGPPRPLIEKIQRSSMQYVKAMAQLFERYRVRGLALESNIRWVEDEAKRLLLEKDRALQQTLNAVRQRLQNQEINDHELLLDVRNLYKALHRAQNKATGTGA
jgi:hypothetical protein